MRKPPVFIVGAGRSGSTMLMELLSPHPRVAWLSPISHRYPKELAWQRRVLKAASAPVIGDWVRSRLGPREAYGFWESHSPGFRRPHRDLVAHDVTEGRRKALVRVVDELASESRPSFVAKITGWPRVLFLREIFPDARFVHLVRDGRAVAASFQRMTVDHWWGWRGPQNWRYGDLDEHYQKLWDATGQSYIALAGIQWMLVLDALERAKRELTNELIEVRYEDLCEDPRGTFARILEHGEIEPSADLERAIAGHEIRERNNSWSAEFTASQQEMLTRLLSEHLQRYRYVA